MTHLRHFLPRAIGCTYPAGAGRCPVPTMRGPLARNAGTIPARPGPTPASVWRRGPPAALAADERPALAQRLARCQWRRTQLLFETSQQRQPGQARHRRRRWAVQVLGPALAQHLPLPDWLASGGPALPLPTYPLATPDAPRDTY